MARKLRGNTTMDMVNAGIAQRNKPIVIKNSTKTYSNNQPSIGDSYNKMVGQYDPDVSKFTGMLPDTSKFTGMLPDTSKFTEQPGENGFYGSMSGLEGASMRLANAASQRTMAEAGYGSGLKKIETAQEYGLKGGLLGQEYGLKGGLIGQEYGLKSGLAQSEADIELSKAAKMAGYSSPFQMQSNIASQRRENERKQREQERLIQESRPYTIDGRGRRVYKK